MLTILITFSCSDNGCIEADDFGEYSTKTLEVSASAALASCDYDTNFRDDLTAATHGAGLANCFQRLNVTLADASGRDHTSTGQGCSKWQPLGPIGTAVNPDANPYLMDVCVSTCIADCNALLLAGANNPNPRWKSTDANEEGGGTVVLSPGAEVYVRATGSISLGGLNDLINLFLPAKHSNSVESFLPTSFNLAGEKKFIHLSNELLSIKLSGGFNDASSGSNRQVGIQNSVTSRIGSITSSSVRPAAINSFKRVVIHTQPVPSGFSTQDDNFVKSSFNGTSTFYSDPSLWKCTYGAGSNNLVPICAQDISLGSGYTNISSDIEAVNSSLNTNFPITARDGSIGSNGRMLKTQSAVNQFGAVDDYLNAVDSCVSPYNSCASFNPLVGGIVGDLSGGNSQVFSANRSSRVYFKYLEPSCASNSSNINVVIRSGRDVSSTENIMYNFNGISVGSDWSSSIGTADEHIPIESGQVIQIVRGSIVPGANDVFSSGGTDIDCGASLVMRFVPYYQVTATKSGLYSFANVGHNGDTTANSSACSLRFRIINPTGSHTVTHFDDIAAEYGTDSSFSTLGADFYEYRQFDDLFPTEEDRSSLTTVVTGFSNHTMNNKIFVRKGQVIRFSPESWEGSWTPVAGSPRKCGVGLAVMFEERPAYLCRGSGSSEISNPECVVANTVDGVQLGCQTNAAACLVAGSNSACPDEILV